MKSSKKDVLTLHPARALTRPPEDALKLYVPSPLRLTDTGMRLDTGTGQTDQLAFVLSLPPAMAGRQASKPGQKLGSKRRNAPTISLPVLLVCKAGSSLMF